MFLFAPPLGTSERLISADKAPPPLPRVATPLPRGGEGAVFSPLRALFAFAEAEAPTSHLKRGGGGWGSGVVGVVGVVGDVASDIQKEEGGGLG